MKLPQSLLRFLRFRLRTLLIFVTFAACGLSWLATKMREAERQRAAVEYFSELGYRFFYDYHDQSDGGRLYRLTNKPSIPSLVLALFGRDLFCNVEAMYLPDGVRSTAMDSDFARVAALPHLKYLNLRRSEITDGGLKHVENLTELEILDLTGRPITDSGLMRLEGLVNLKNLWMFRTQVSDAGLVHLSSLTKLTYLDVQDTHVTRQGANELQKSLPKCTIVD